MLGIKSKIILKKIFEKTVQYKYFQLIKYNKSLQKKLGISINDYKECNQIIFELKTTKTERRKKKIINIDSNNKSFVRIYINDSQDEYKNNYIIDNEGETTKIKIEIYSGTKILKNLFKNCEFIEEINCVKFNNKNFIDMKGMFYGCKRLTKLNLLNFHTDKVTNMSVMFNECSSLKELNLSNFDTLNVQNMSLMFNECSSLKELNISNFDTSKVTDISYMFNECSSLKKLNLLNLNITKITNVDYMFQRCSSLEKLKLSNSFIYKIIDKNNYLFNCCKELNEINFPKCRCYKERNKLYGYINYDHIYNNEFYEISKTSKKYVYSTSKSFDEEDINVVYLSFSNYKIQLNKLLNNKSIYKFIFK